uniref:Sugar ABC transporter permease n=1 Tax=Caldilinea aerophila TaxID=133453 RepID=A0A7C1JLI3_9CHLR
MSVISKAASPPGPRTRTGGSRALARREAMWGYLFISPFILGLLAFTLIPTVATFVMSFTNFNLSGAGTQFVGVSNYQRLFRDPQVWSSLLVTVRFAAIALPVGLILPFGLAVLLNSESLRAKGLFRTLFYFPYIVPFVAAIFVWGALLNSETGWINQFLRWVGVANPPNWLNSTVWIYPALVILGLWGIGNAMLIFLASLQGVPTELYDAAKIDGAGWWGQMFNVTLPMISPVIFYNLTLSLIGLFQYFTVPLVLNQGTGAPGGATMFYNLYLYKTFFTYQNMAYGATMAWLLFVIILAVTLVLFQTAKYWVYYAAETR